MYVFVLYHLGVPAGFEAAVALANILKINIHIFCGKNLIQQNIKPQDCGSPESFIPSNTIFLSYLYAGHYDAVVNTPDSANPIYDQFDTERTKNIKDDLLLAQQLDSRAHILKVKRNLSFR